MGSAPPPPPGSKSIFTYVVHNHEGELDLREKQFFFFLLGHSCDQHIEQRTFIPAKYLGLVRAEMYKQHS